MTTDSGGKLTMTAANRRMAMKTIGEQWQLRQKAMTMADGGRTPEQPGGDSGSSSRACVSNET